MQQQIMIVDTTFKYAKIERLEEIWQKGFYNDTQKIKSAGRKIKKSTESPKLRKGFLNKTQLIYGLEKVRSQFQIRSILMNFSMCNIIINGVMIYKMS